MAAMKSESYLASQSSERLCQEVAAEELSMFRHLQLERSVVHLHWCDRAHTYLVNLKVYAYRECNQYILDTPNVDMHQLNRRFANIFMLAPTSDRGGQNAEIVLIILSKCCTLSLDTSHGTCSPCSVQHCSKEHLLHAGMVFTKLAQLGLRLGHDIFRPDLCKL